MRCWICSILGRLYSYLRCTHDVKLDRCAIHGVAFMRVVGIRGYTCSQCEWESKQIQKLP